jgi:hypothetical protein
MDANVYWQRIVCKLLRASNNGRWAGAPPSSRGPPLIVSRGGPVIIYSAGPLWLRVLIAIGAAVLFVVLAWSYYTHFWRRR